MHYNHCFCSLNHCGLPESAFVKNNCSGLQCSRRASKRQDSRGDMQSGGLPCFKCKDTGLPLEWQAWAATPPGQLLPRDAYAALHLSTRQAHCQAVVNLKLEFSMFFQIFSLIRHLWFQFGLGWLN